MNCFPRAAGLLAFTLLIGQANLYLVPCAQGADPAPAVATAPDIGHRFRKIQVTDKFWGEGAGIGDFNHDGIPDVVSGPFWYEGPDFTKRHEYRPANFTFTRKKAGAPDVTIEGFEGALGTQNGYSNNFLTFVYDFNGDGWPDILVIGYPGTPAIWYENPRGGTGHWAAHEAFDVVDNESPAFADLDGSGRPQLICSKHGYLGYAKPDWNKPDAPWTFHRLSPHGSWERYTHGLGVGDINGDGRMDLIMADGWWEQPASLSGDPVWKFHPFAFAEGGAQMYAYDVNGDGRNDVITCLNPHRYGLVWWEQLPHKEGAEITFKQHLIMGQKPQENPYGVAFSQPHAIALFDMDGDGLLDIVTGKRFWAHGPTGDVAPNAPAVLYWFRLVRDPATHEAQFIPYLVDDNSGVGTQVIAGHAGGDPKLGDIVVGNKKGTFVFLHQKVDAGGH